MCPDLSQLDKSPLNPPGLTLVVRAKPLIDSYCFTRGLVTSFYLKITFIEDDSVLVEWSLPFM